MNQGEAFQRATSSALYSPSSWIYSIINPTSKINNEFLPVFPTGCPELHFLGAGRRHTDSSHPLDTAHSLGFKSLDAVIVPTPSACLTDFFITPQIFPRCLLGPGHCAGPWELPMDS